MREIKFRCWDKVNKKYLTEWRWKGQSGTIGCIIELSDSKTPRSPSEFIIEQYAGLKDKNYKDIYEGHVIKWLSKEWEIKVDQTHGIRFLYGKDQITKGVADNCEIIGNIHEK